jgi:hypothetical protein
MTRVAHHQAEIMQSVCLFRGERMRLIFHLPRWGRILRHVSINVASSLTDLNPSFTSATVILEPC